MTDWSDEAKARLERLYALPAHDVPCQDAIRSALEEIERLESLIVCPDCKEFRGEMEAKLADAIPEDVMMRSQEIAAENEVLRAKLAEAEAAFIARETERDRLLRERRAEVERLREALASYDCLSLVIETAVREMRDRDSREACNYEALLRTIDPARAAVR